MLTIRMLKTFLLVVRTGSFAAAAEGSALTQPAVGLQMRALEKALNRDLFVRGSGRHASLTQHGCDIYPKVELILDLLDDLESKPHGATAGGRRSTG